MVAGMMEVGEAPTGAHLRAVVAEDWAVDGPAGIDRPDEFHRVVS